MTAPRSTAPRTTASDSAAAPAGEPRLELLDRLRRRDLVVVRVEDVTPRYRRVVFGGGDLARGFPIARFAPGDHVKLYFPHPATGVITSYRDAAGPGEEQDWELDGPGEVVRRDYTPRAFDARAGELTIEFVLHEHGVAGRWAARAEPGDRLVAIGPRAHRLLPDDFRCYLAIGDASAIPSIARVLEEAPDGAVVTAVIEVADARERQPLGGAGREVRWVGPGELEAAVRTLELPDPAGLFVFAAGEAGLMRPLRRWARHEVGLPKRQVVVDGYWKRGAADFDHHEADVGDD
jgi:NADPH-dependent ferric siderophore reductase